MFPTPTALPTGGPTPPFSLDGIGEYINIEQTAIDAVGWWRIGMETAGTWDDISGMLLAVLVLLAFISIVAHLSSLSDNGE